MFPDILWDIMRCQKAISVTRERKPHLPHSCVNTLALWSSPGSPEGPRALVPSCTGVMKGSVAQQQCLGQLAV